MTSSETDCPASRVPTRMSERPSWSAPLRTALPPVVDAVAGVAAGRAGGFRLVIGLDRNVGEEALLRAGADLVVSDLAQLAPAHL